MKLSQDNKEECKAKTKFVFEWSNVVFLRITTIYIFFLNNQKSLAVCVVKMCCFFCVFKVMVYLIF